LSLDENHAGGNAAARPRIVPLSSPDVAITLWWCELHATREQLESYATVLSAAEHARAARFGAQLLRDRYVIGRSALRLALSQRLGVAAADVPIVRGARGRPQLEGNAQLDFNVSHTGDVALIGLRDGGRIGVDVERFDRTINVDGIARKFMTARERGSLAMTSTEHARRTVLTLWTCKEAMSKATGDALSAPFAAIDIDLRGGREPRDGPGKYRPAAWTLYAASVPDDYVATIAVCRMT
jgi:4'-phosphopantetheinyl transferase